MEDNQTTPVITPVTTHNGPAGTIYMKRDDTFEVAGVKGGKARTCWALAQGATGLVTASSRQSPQAVIVSFIATHLNIPCRVHMPTGPDTPQMELVRQAGGHIVQHKPGYNSVIIRRAKDDIKGSDWTHIPFGMECQEAVIQTSGQVVNLPWDRINRIVVPVGSGMSLAGVLHGIQTEGYRRQVKVLGVWVGADPTPRLSAYAPFSWRLMVDMVQSPLDYHTHAPITSYGGVELDPVYEAKCIDFLQQGDLLWVVGIREPRNV